MYMGCKRSNRELEFQLRTFMTSATHGCLKTLKKDFEKKSSEILTYFWMSMVYEPGSPVTLEPPLPIMRTQNEKIFNRRCFVCVNCLFAQTNKHLPSWNEFSFSRDVFNKRWINLSVAN